MGRKKCENLAPEMDGTEFIETRNFWNRMERAKFITKRNVLKSWENKTGEIYDGGIKRNETWIDRNVYVRLIEKEQRMEANIDFIKL